MLLNINNCEALMGG